MDALSPLYELEEHLANLDSTNPADRLRAAAHLAAKTNDLATLSKLRKILVRRLVEGHAA